MKVLATTRPEKYGRVVLDLSVGYGTVAYTVQVMYPVVTCFLFLRSPFQLSPFSAERGELAVLKIKKKR